MLRFTFIIAFLCTSVYLSQGQYTLTQALQDASTKNSTATLIDLARQEADLKYSIASHKNLPQLNLVAQSTYQSETSGIDLSFPGVTIPRLSKDQYKAQLDISQNIYDGGAISALKDNARLEGELNAINAVADMDKIKERVILLYFGILEVDKRLENLQLVKDDLNGIEKRLTAAVQNGISLKSELNNIKVEQINVATQENELSTIRKTLTSQLEVWTHHSLAPSDKLEIPSTTLIDESFNKQLPALAMFGIQKKQISLAQRLDEIARRPKIGAFAQLGYGKPGLNFLKNEFAPYYLVGVRAQWNISSFYDQSHQNKLNALYQSKLQVKEDLVYQQLNTQAIQMQNDIAKLEDTKDMDSEIILLRKQIKETGAVQLENGAITSADYLLKLNDYKESILKLELNQILARKTQYLLKHLKGY